MVKDHLGNEYKSEVMRAHAYGKDVGDINKLLKTGHSLEYALTHTSQRHKGKIVKDHLGKEYSSLRELCKQYNLPVSVYYTRRKRHWTLERTLTTEYPTREGKYAPNKAKDHLGKEFYSEKDMCKAYKLSYHAYRSRKQSGWSLEKILTTPLAHFYIKNTYYSYFCTFNNEHYYKCKNKDCNKTKILTLEEIYEL